MNIQILTENPAVRVIDGQILTPIIPDPELGYYKSMVQLQQDGHDIKNFIDHQMIARNPKRFHYLPMNK